MLSYFIEPGRVHVDLSWRNTSLDIYIYECSSKTRRLLDEAEYRGFKPEKPITLLPADLINNHIQLIQGSIYYKLYSTRLQRIRNQGLLLALFILGTRQLNELVDLIESGLANSDRYYLVGVDAEPVNTSDCSKVVIQLGGSVDVTPLVKNTRFLISIA